MRSTPLPCLPGPVPAEGGAGRHRWGGNLLFIPSPPYHPSARSRFGEGGGEGEGEGPVG